MKRCSRASKPYRAIALVAILLSAARLVAQQASYLASSSVASARMIAGRFGPYGGMHTAEDARQLNLASFNLVLPSNFSPELRAALFSEGAAYIDHELWWLI